MKKKQKQVMQSNYFLRTGLKLFRKATGKKLDLYTLVKESFDKESLSRHNLRLNSDPEFRDPDALISEVTSMLLSTPGDSFYPKLSKRNKKWIEMLGIEPQESRFGYAAQLLLYYRYLLRVVCTLAKDVIVSVNQARQKGSLQGTPIHDKTNYLLSRSIANRHGYDKGRQRNPVKHGEDDNSQADFVHREVKLDITRDALTTDTGIDQIEMKMVFQRFMDIYERMPRVDQLAIRTRILESTEKMSFVAAYRHYQAEFNQEGIATCRGARKRLDSLEIRYPEFREIREAMNN